MRWVRPSSVRCRGVDSGRADKGVENVFALIGAIAGVVSNILQEDLYKVQNHLSSDYVFCKALLLGVLDRLSSVFDCGRECVDVGRSIFEPIQHAADHSRLVAGPCESAPATSVRKSRHH